MTNNALSNINKNKVSLSKLEYQYSTGKKIQRPSEDPVVAVRALKLRKNLDELNQYYERNIPDAKSWMDTTEGALTNINTTLTTIYQQFTQGSNDALSTTDRVAIIETLMQLKNQIYQEGNTNYAGRYVFTGYKTDTSLTFTEDTSDTVYNIKETFAGSDITPLSVVTGGSTLSDYDPTTSNGTSFTETPQTAQVYRLRLAYDNLVQPTTDQIQIMVDGNPVDVNVVASGDKDAYVFAAGDDTPRFIADTGEIIFPKSQFDQFSTAKTIEVSYTKDEFKQYDLRPEHYFECDATGKAAGSQTVFYKNEDQQIQYEINFGQKLTINTQAKDAFTHTMAREINELYNVVLKVEDIENQISAVTDKLKEANISDDQKEALTNLKEALEVELVLQEKIMQETFSKGMTTTEQVQNNMNASVAELGSKYVRLELVEDRLSTQQTEFEELLSTNEDADLVETIIKFTAQETVYNASLSVASKVSRNTLLDFI